MKHRTFKLLALAAMTAAIMALPASAQMAGKRGGGGEPPKGEEKPKVDEKAYKAAMERIPAPKEKYDPWGGVTPAPAATPAKKKQPPGDLDGRHRSPSGGAPVRPR